MEMQIGGEKCGPGGRNGRKSHGFWTTGAGLFKLEREESRNS